MLINSSDSIEMTIPPSEFQKDLIVGSIKKAMLGASSSDLWKIRAADLDTLKVMPDLNVRISGEELDAHIRSLADSIKTEGFKNSKPIEVFILEEPNPSYDETKDGADKRYKSVMYVSDGHCRLKAVKIAIAEGAEILQVPVVTLPTKGLSLQDIVAGLVLNNTGKNLTSFEIALVCKRLANYGWSNEKIGKRFGYSAANVDILLDAVSAPMSIVAMIQNGEVSLTTAVEVLRKHGHAAVEMLKNGLESAKANGKKSVTPSYIQGVALGKVIKRQAEPLYQAAKSISADPAFASLSAENQKLLLDLLSGISASEAKVEAKLQKKCENE